MTTSSHRASLVTPRGTGAIAVIRLVGPDPESILRDVWECGAGGSLLNNVWHGRLARADTAGTAMPHRGKTVIKHSVTPLTEGRLSYVRLLDGGETLDDVLLSVERVSDHERAVEISCHGGVHIVQRVLRLLEGRGATVASKFEESQVWPAGNKIEAEAIEALANVKTQRAARYAAYVRQALPHALKGYLSNQTQNCRNVTKGVTELLAGFDAARALLEGVTVCLIGPPNSGKSTLFNKLLGRQAVVTSAVAGTTRDWVAETVEVEGLAVELVDTAGRRETQCELEKQAIEAGNFPLARSDLTLLILDQSVPFPQEAADWVRHAPQLWVVGNKSDLPKCWTQDDLVRLEPTLGSTAKFVSARTGEGCELLKKAIVKHFGLLDPASPALAFFTERQRALAARALDRREFGREFFLSLLGMDLAESDRKGL